MVGSESGVAATHARWHFIKFDQKITGSEKKHPEKMNSSLPLFTLRLFRVIFSSPLLNTAKKETRSLCFFKLCSISIFLQAQSFNKGKIYRGERPPYFYRDAGL